MMCSPVPPDVLFPDRCFMTEAADNYDRCPFIPNPVLDGPYKGSDFKLACTRVDELHNIPWFEISEPDH